MNFQIDTLFFDLSHVLRQFPTLFVSFISIVVCNACVIFAKKYYGALGLCCCMVIFNILGNIQVLYATSYQFLNLPVLLGTVTLSSSFLACDTINENYGYKEAKKAVFLSFFCQVLFFVNVIITLGHQPIDISSFPNFSMTQYEIDRNILAIEQIFLPIPRLLIASYIAYLISQLFEVWLYRITKRISFIKSAYIKHNISLFFSSVVVDTLLFTFIALVLLSREPLSLGSFWSICVSAWLMRIICNMVNSFSMKINF